MIRKAFFPFFLIKDLLTLVNIALYCSQAEIRVGGWCKPIIMSNRQPSCFGLLLGCVAVALLGFGVMTIYNSISSLTHCAKELIVNFKLLSVKNKHPRQRLELRNWISRQDVVSGGVWRLLEIF